MGYSARSHVWLTASAPDAGLKLCVESQDDGGLAFLLSLHIILLEFAAWTLGEFVWSPSASLISSSVGTFIKRCGLVSTRGYFIKKTFTG